MFLTVLFYATKGWINYWNFKLGITSPVYGLIRLQNTIQDVISFCFCVVMVANMAAQKTKARCIGALIILNCFHDKGMKDLFGDFLFWVYTT